MHVWMVRNAEKTRFRVQLEPADPTLWLGWEVREGQVARGEWDALFTADDTVEIERLHQEMWRSLEH
jgi:hypothetical protein